MSRPNDRAYLGALLFALAIPLACKERDPIYPAPQAPGTPLYPATDPGAPLPAPAATQGPVATSAAPPLAPALGFFCASDGDAQCPYGHCLNGRCGGCADATQCKPNAQCFPTWFGGACLPAQQSPPPVAAPAPAPAPNAVPAVPASPATPAVPASPAQQPVLAAPSTPSASGDSLERVRARCLTRLNEYRARVGVAPLSMQSDRSSCADAQARSDAGTRKAHGAFGQCRESSQNECPSWSGSLDEVVDRCLAMMFAEGPQGGHYENITDRNVRSVACGVFSGGAGEIWMVQDFFR
jgi:hypothetical protein